MTRILGAILFLLSITLAPDAMAYGFGKQAPVAYPTPKTASRLGHVTGNDCVTDNDCWQACVSKDGEDKKVITCLNVNDGSSNCPDADTPPVGAQCVCLSDVKHCGYASGKHR